MRLHIGKAFNSLKLTDYLEQEEKKVEKHDKQCSDALRGVPSATFEFVRRHCTTDTGRNYAGLRSTTGTPKIC